MRDVAVFRLHTVHISTRCVETAIAQRQEKQRKIIRRETGKEIEAEQRGIEELKDLCSEASIKRVPWIAVVKGMLLNQVIAFRRILVNLVIPVLSKFTMMQRLLALFLVFRSSSKTAPLLHEQSSLRTHISTPVQMLNSGPNDVRQCSTGSLVPLPVCFLLIHFQIFTQKYSTGFGLVSSYSGGFRGLAGLR